MTEIIGVMACPVCSKEVKVKLNSNKKPTLYCSGCKVQVSSSGGDSLKAIMAQVRPGAETAAKKEEKADVQVVKGGDDNGQGVPENRDNGGAASEGKRGGLLSRLWTGE